MKITILIAGKPVELTMDQARELHAELDVIFGRKERVVPAPWYDPMQQPPWHQQIWYQGPTCGTGY